MAKKSTKKRRSTGSGKKKAKTARPGYDFDTDLRKMRKRLAAARPPGQRPRGRGMGMTESETTPLELAGSTTVPKKSVGAAVQAAVSFENATHVVAEAADATASNFTVSWQ